MTCFFLLLLPQLPFFTSSIVGLGWTYRMIRQSSSFSYLSLRHYFLNVSNSLLHLIFCRPLFRIECLWIRTVSRAVQRLSAILATRPAHCHLSFLMVSVICLTAVFRPTFCDVLWYVHAKSSLILPCAGSMDCSLRLNLLVRCHVSAP